VIREHGATVAYPVDIPDLSVLKVGGEPATTDIACKYMTPSAIILLYSARADVTVVWEFKHLGVPEFIRGLAQSKVHSLQDIIGFNKQHKDITLPESELLLR
jgi:hypothetical protein